MKLPSDLPVERRQAACRRTEAYRDRRRRGVMLVQIELEPGHLAALERLTLLPPGERDPGEIAFALTEFLAAAGPLAALIDAILPVPDGDASPV